MNATKVVRCLLVFVAVLAAPTVAQAAYTLQVSTSATRSSPKALAGAALSGNAYIFLSPSTGVTQARFWLDNPSMTGTPRHTETYAPWDFAGGSISLANPFNTTTVPDGSHMISVALTLTSGAVKSLTVTFTVANATPTSPPPSSGVSIYGTDFYLNGVLTYRGKPAQGLLMNVRMVNCVFEDTSGLKPTFHPEANTEEFLAAMPSYVSAGVRAFTVNLQGGNPSYEGARNTAFYADGSLKSTYLARVERVIRKADSLGAVIILGFFYFRQDQHLRDSTAVKAGVVNAMQWLKAEGFTNVLVEIANEHTHPWYDHAIIRTSSGMASLIRLAKATAPTFYVSASPTDVSLSAEVAHASDYLLIHTTNISTSNLAAAITTFKPYGKPIVINEDEKYGSTGALAAQIAVQTHASWGAFQRKNQAYPFTFGGTADDPTLYSAIKSLTQ